MPVVVCVILGYIIASGFFAVFSTTVNTLMLCFCEGNYRVKKRSKVKFDYSDCRVNDGTPEKPYFMPRGMMQFVAGADQSIKGGDYAAGENVPLRTMR